MKARNKKTGEIIEVELYNGIRDDEFAYQAPAGKDRWILFRQDELDFEDLIDWSSFRREAAKDMLCALISANPTYSLEKGLGAKAAIEYADALIAELKHK